MQVSLGLSGIDCDDFDQTVYDEACDAVLSNATFEDATCALYTEGNYPVLGNLQCTDGAVRKEAVKHGKHVWLYPGGYNMGPRDAKWSPPSWEEMRMMLASGGWPAGSENGVAAVAVLGVVCAVIVAALVAARHGRRGAGAGGGAGGGGKEAEGLLSADDGGGAYGAAASP